jgi:hypothetical protein
MLVESVCRRCGSDVLTASGFGPNGRWIVRYACRSCATAWEVEEDRTDEDRPEPRLRRAAHA